MNVPGQIARRGSGGERRCEQRGQDVGEVSTRSNEVDHDPTRRVEVLRRCCTEDIVFMDPTLGRLHGLEAVSDMIGNYIGTMSAGANGASEASVGERRGRSGGGVSVEVVTPIEQFHGFFRYSFVWKLPDGSVGPGTDFWEVADDGRMRLITVWPGSNDFPVPCPRPCVRAFIATSCTAKTISATRAGGSPAAAAVLRTS